MSGQLHAPAALLPGKEPQDLLDRKLSGPQSRSGRLGKEKILDLTETRTPTSRSSSPSLYRLRYPGSQSIPTICFIIEFFIFFYLNIGGWSPYWVHSALRPLLAYCTCLPRVIVRMEKLVEWTVLAGETEVVEENLPQRHFVHHKSRRWIRAAAVGSQRLTASDMARP
jgi:hypothetical protein